MCTRRLSRAKHAGLVCVCRTLIACTGRVMRLHDASRVCNTLAYNMLNACVHRTLIAFARRLLGSNNFMMCA